MPPSKHNKLTKKTPPAIPIPDFNNQPTGVPLKRRRWTRIHQLLHDNHGLRYFVMALGFIIAVGLALVGWIMLAPEPAATPAVIVTKPKKVDPPKYYSPLTGNLVPDEATTKWPVTAIMLENSIDSRPQSGLQDAGVTFEAIAEGGITRFISLYQEAKPTLIGPVRSVRPYYVEWAAGFGNSLAHIGGSARALDMIRSGKYGVDLDQFFNAGSYWRAKDRYAPHNVYTSFEKLDALNTAKGHTTSSFTAWPRTDGKKVDTPGATGIDIAVSSGSYSVHYDYLPDRNIYRRFMGGVVHRDREKGEITPAVVIAMRVPMTRGFEDGYREQINTIGSGQAYIFQNGTVTEATWKKTGPKDQISFTAADGKPVDLNRGQTWITALAAEKSVTWR